MKTRILFVLAVALCVCSCCSHSASDYQCMLPEVVITSYGHVGTHAITPEMAGKIVEIPEIPEKAAKAYENLSDKPTFEGKDAESFSKYLIRNALYPMKALESGHAGTTYVSFVVSADGSVTDVNLACSSWDELDKPVLNFVSRSKNWTPARNNGREVAVTYILPVTFFLR